MGANRAHFAKPVKCGEKRIAPSRRPIGGNPAWVGVDHVGHRPVVDEVDAVSPEARPSERGGAAVDRGPG